jgi:hypothetical protein
LDDRPERQNPATGQGKNQNAAIYAVFMLFLSPSYGVPEGRTVH